MTEVEFNGGHIEGLSVMQNTDCNILTMNDIEDIKKIAEYVKNHPELKLPKYEESK